MYNNEGDNEVINEPNNEGGPPEAKLAGEHPPAGVNGPAGEVHDGASKPPVGSKSFARRNKGTRLSEDWEASERDRFRTRPRYAGPHDPARGDQVQKPLAGHTGCEG